MRREGVRLPELQSTRDEIDVYEQLMTTIGTTVCTGTALEKRRALDVLHGCVSYSPVAAQSLSQSAKSWQTSLDCVPPLIDLARYTMALQEHGDRHGEAPVYSYQTLSLYPPHFECAVTIQGGSYKSGAKSKKLARHLASREACEALGVKPL